MRSDPIRCRVLPAPAGCCCLQALLGARVVLPPTVAGAASALPGLNAAATAGGTVWDGMLPLDFAAASTFGLIPELACEQYLSGLTPNPAVAGAMMPGSRQDFEQAGWSVRLVPARAGMWAAAHATGPPPPPLQQQTAPATLDPAAAEGPPLPGGYDAQAPGARGLQLAHSAARTLLPGEAADGWLLPPDGWVGALQLVSRLGVVVGPIHWVRLARAPRPELVVRPPRRCLLRPAAHPTQQQQQQRGASIRRAERLFFFFFLFSIFHVPFPFR